MDKFNKLIIALFIAMCMTTAHAQEVRQQDATTDTMAPTGVPTLHDTTAETSSEDPHWASEDGPIPVVPLEEPVLTEAITEPTEGVPDTDGDVEVEVEEESSWLDSISSFITSHFESGMSKAKTMHKKRQYVKEYGEGSDAEPNFSTLLEIEAAEAEADERRRQQELAALVEQQEKQRLYDESLYCLALNGYHESRSETADQEVASAAVVLNRLSVGFRDATTVCEVIYTPKQFSWVEQHGTHLPDTTNKIEKRAWNRSVLIARRMLDPDATFVDPSNGAQYYYNPHIVDWKYKDAYRQTAVLGNHRFMAEKDPSHPHYIDNRKVRINPVLFNGLSHAERNKLKAEYQSKGE